MGLELSFNPDDSKAGKFFALKELPPIKNQEARKLSGLFFAGFLEETEDIKIHNIAGTYFVTRYYKAYRKMIDFLYKFNSSTKEEERKKHKEQIEALHKILSEISEEIKAFYMNPDAFMENLLDWDIKKQMIIKINEKNAKKIRYANFSQENIRYSTDELQDDLKFKLYRAVYKEDEDTNDVTIYYYDNDEVIELTKDMEYSEKIILIKLSILEDLLRYAKDEEVKEWLSEMVKIKNNLNVFLDAIKLIKQYTLDKLLSIIDIDFYLGVYDEFQENKVNIGELIDKEEDEVLDEVLDLTNSANMMTDKPIITRISTNEKKLTFDDLLERILKSKDSAFMHIKTKEDVIAHMNRIKANLGIDLEFLLKKMYPENKRNRGESIEFLKKLNREFRHYLKLSHSDKSKTYIKAIKYGKDRNSIIDIDEVYVKNKNNSEFVILYEMNDKDEANNFKNIIKSYIKGERVDKYLQINNISNPLYNSKDKQTKKNIIGMPLEILFTDFQKLKKIGTRPLTDDENFLLSNFILQLSSFLLALSELRKIGGGNENENENNSLQENIDNMMDIFVFSLLNPKRAEEEANNNTIGRRNDNKYEFWDIARVFASLLAFPLQTVNTGDIQQKFNSKSAIKNLFLSAMRDTKKIHYVLSKNILTVNIDEAKIYYIIEHPSNYLYGNAKNYFYEVISINISKREHDDKMIITVERYKDHKTGTSGFYLIAGDNVSANNFKEFLERDDGSYKFLLISDPDSLAKKYLDKQKIDNCYYILYRGIKTPILLDKSKGLKQGFLLYSKDIEKGTENIKVPNIMFKHPTKNYYMIAPPIIPHLVKEHVINSNEKELLVNIELSLFFPEQNLQDITIVNLSILSSLLWLSYRTEAFSYVISKPKFLQKQLPNITLKRNIDGQARVYEYQFDTFSCLLELATLLEEMFIKTV